MPKSVAADTDLMRQAAPWADIFELAEHLRTIRGIHHVDVDVKTRFTDWNPETHRHETVDANPWVVIRYRGTERGVHGAANAVMLSGLREVDPNADHDHEACIASARSMGVPAWAAHTPETYLSS